VVGAQSTSIFARSRAFSFQVAGLYGLKFGASSGLVRGFCGQTCFSAAGRLQKQQLHFIIKVLRNNILLVLIKSRQRKFSGRLYTIISF